MPDSVPFVWLLAAGVPIVVAAVWFAARGGRRRRPRPVIVLGPGAVAAFLAREAARQPHCRFRMLGHVHDRPDRTMKDGVPWLGRAGDLRAIIRTHRPAAIVLARGRLPCDLEEPLLAARLGGIRIEDALGFHERLTGKVAIEAIGPDALVLGDGFRHSDLVPSDLYLSLTRLGNVTAALAGLVVLAPLLALVAVAIVLDSRGPVLFVQPRVGHGGRPFGLYKFRTMQPATRRRSEWVRDNGDRITRVGRWLRRLRLDELPQLVNVLRGEMNLVGPRPHPTSNAALFFQRIPYYGVRTAVRPGITGWAQIRYGYANSLEEETEKMRYDLYYIKHRSLGMDLRILLETAALLVSNSGLHEAARHRAPAPLGGSQRGVRMRVSA